MLVKNETDDETDLVMMTSNNILYLIITSVVSCFDLNVSHFFLSCINNIQVSTKYKIKVTISVVGNTFVCSTTIPLSLTLSQVGQ